VVPYRGVICEEGHAVGHHELVGLVQAEGRAGDPCR
jgi:hypothetical protein